MTSLLILACIGLSLLILSCTGASVVLLLAIEMLLRDRRQS